MASHGIFDRVAIVGMGCTAFKEHWDRGLDDLSLDASNEAFASAGITKDDVDAYWLGTAQSAMSGITLARALQLEGKPVTRVENYCATGSEALRQAAYAVASGAYDVAMAVGVEKVKDSGYQGLNAYPVPSDGTTRTLTAAGSFSMVAPAYAAKYGVPIEQIKRTLGRIASKNHHNGARNPRAQFRREMSVDQICAMPAVAGDLSVFDCAGVADGAAAAIVVPSRRRAQATATTRSTSRRSQLRGRQRLAASLDPDYDYTTFPEIAAQRRGRLRPGRRRPIPSGPDRHGRGARLLHPHRAGAHGGPPVLRTGPGRGKTSTPARFDLGGELPVNPDGGLKSFGHPVGASGLRMMFEAWLQLRGEAPRGPHHLLHHRGRDLALTHNLGGYPGEMVSFVGIVGPSLG